MGYHVLTMRRSGRAQGGRCLGLIVASRCRGRGGAVDVPAERAPLRHGRPARYNVDPPGSESPGLVRFRTHEAVHEHPCGEEARESCAATLRRRVARPGGRGHDVRLTSSGELRLKRGARHERAELALIQGLEQHDWYDAFGRCTGTRGATGHGGGRTAAAIRLTMSSSPGDRARGCQYLDARREQDDDHSALLAELAIPIVSVWRRLANTPIAELRSGSVPLSSASSTPQPEVHPRVHGDRAARRRRGRAWARTSSTRPRSTTRLRRLRSRTPAGGRLDAAIRCRPDLDGLDLFLSDRTAGPSRDYRRRAFENAALDLALRQAGEPPTPPGPRAPPAELRPSSAGASCQGRAGAQAPRDRPT